VRHLPVDVDVEWPPGSIVGGPARKGRIAYEEWTHWDLEPWLLRRLQTLRRRA